MLVSDLHRHEYEIIENEKSREGAKQNEATSGETNNRPYNGALNQAKYYMGEKHFGAFINPPQHQRRRSMSAMEKQKMISHPEKLRNKQKESQREFAVRLSSED